MLRFFRMATVITVILAYFNARTGEAFREVDYLFFGSFRGRPPMSSRLQNTRDFHRHCTDYFTFFLKWSSVKRIFELSTFFGVHAATDPRKTHPKLKAWLVFACSQIRD